MDSRVLLVLAGAIAGGVAGVGGALAVSTVLRPAGAPAAVPPPATPPAALTTVQVVSPSLDPARLAAVESAVAALAASATAPPRTAAQQDLPGLSAEELKTKGLAEIHSRLAAHEAQGVDASWAPGAEKSLRTDFAEVATSARATVLGVHCKTTSCKVDLEWNSYAEANDAISEITRAQYALNCMRSISLLDPPVQGARYRASAMFDCTELRHPSGG
ncbi:MAG: hypothetical protein HYV09_22195 [Deltaproteobacteria bacterium]|nr:hypothetical protein [Deltaproteobacteria bacterium]